MNSKKNIVYIISHVTKSYIFEWTIIHLNKDKNNFAFILLNEDNTELEEFIRKSNLPFYRIPYRGKKDFIFCLWKTYRILKKIKADIVHTHLFEACLIGLIAAYFAGVRKRIHTRHNATYHIKYFPWMVKYDKLINYLSTDIIAISENVKNILVKQENAIPDKIKVIHHGFDFDYISNISNERVELIRKKYKIPLYSTVIGVISRYIHWKGIQYIIPAVKEFMKDYPDTFLVLANAEGPYESEIKKLLKNIPRDKYIEIKFESDVFALFRCFDYFIHVPIDAECEAFGLVYIEAMACKIPSIITLSGVVTEFTEHKNNALIVPHKSIDEIYKCLEELSQNSELAKSISEKAYNDIISRFDIKKSVIEIENLYE
jgi:glycosyltransferase involved in cell wall biosynthesis